MTGGRKTQVPLYNIQGKIRGIQVDKIQNFSIQAKAHDYHTIFNEISLVIHVIQAISSAHHS